MKWAVPFLAAVAVLFPLASRAAPKAELWNTWTAHQANSTQSIDHGGFDAFLKAYVVESADGINRVAYGKAKAGRAPLDGYLERLATVPISRFNRPQQFAFWVNLYNALTLRVILDHYPVGSIRDIDISPGLFSDGPWGGKLIEVEGRPLSLDDIEHRILRPVWKDPRIHYAVNCAALGCPNLQITAFTAENSEKLLAKAAREYINHPRGVRVADGELTVSSLYDWYADDFGGSDEAIIGHFNRYAAPVLKGALRGLTRIGGDGYDWALNDAD